MELNDLIIFKTVVNEGSISRAAKELGYVQPNITARIKKLEQELETQLIHRNNKGISLLPSGEILLNYIDEILNLIEKAKTEIKMGGESYRIATTQAILSNYLSIRIQDYFKNYQLYMENSQNLRQLLKKQTVDMIITYEEYSDPEFKKIFTTKISMGLLKAKGRSNIDYSKEFFFVSHDRLCPFRNYTIEFMEKHDLSKEQLQQVDSYSLIQEFIDQGKGIAFLPVNNHKLEKTEEVEIEKIPIYFFTNRKSKKVIPSELFK